MSLKTAIDHEKNHDFFAYFLVLSPLHNHHTHTQGISIMIIFSPYAGFTKDHQE